jgi:hypothetical protein
MRSLVLLTALFLSTAGLACEYTLSMCQRQVTELIAHRTKAIEYAFGELHALPEKIDVKFVSPRDPEYTQVNGRLMYELDEHRIIVPRRFISSKLPNPLRWAAHYWPFYQDGLYIDEYPIIGAIDNAIWSAYMEEAAHRAGTVWPHEGCVSAEIGLRLPCEMLLQGIAEMLTTPRQPLFNENRLDRIWPEDFKTFQARVQRSDKEYRDVQRYGGILLVRPIVGEFGVPRALAYIARTPFRVEGDSMRVAALEYQERARVALSSDIDRVAASSVTHESSR